MPLGEVKLGPGSEDGVADAKRRLLPADSPRAFPRRFFLLLFKLHHTRFDAVCTIRLSENTQHTQNTPGLPFVHKRLRKCPRWRFPRSSASLSQRFVCLSHPRSPTATFHARILTDRCSVCSRLHLPSIRHRAHLPRPPLQQGHRPIWNPRPFHRLRSKCASTVSLHLLARHPWSGLMALLRHQAARAAAEGTWSCVHSHRRLRHQRRVHHHVRH